ncbi:organic hydroperoxide resistance protein [Nocardioides aestuarii]|uniref:Organic hydroperoxide resistance protein n=1 Tax=Nocardioides aestuarii TaxID=252231 RepID=A0ABW4TKH1_9ACTN
MTQTPEKIVYTANATVTGGRRGGHGKTDDGQLEVDLQAPVEMGGPGGGTNPEQLFAVGYGACFTGALGLAGKAEGVDTSGATTQVAVGFGPEGESFAIAVELAVTIPGVDDQTAQKLVDRTHELCPYSKAVRGNVDVTVTGKGA